MHIGATLIMTSQTKFGKTVRTLYIDPVTLYILCTLTVQRMTVQVHRLISSTVSNYVCIIICAVGVAYTYVATINNEIMVAN